MATNTTTNEGKTMPNWYHYEQPLDHKFGYDYDEKKGLSAEIYVEADNADEADDLILSISNIGFVKRSLDYWDERVWTPASRWSRVDESDVPSRDAIHFPETRDSEDKISKDGQFEAFVHPKNGEFYGVWK